MKRVYLTLFLGLIMTLPGRSQYSVAREWNEVLLSSIRVDIGRPTVHARNLFHVSAAMYDAWAVFDDRAEPYLLGKTVHGFEVPFGGFTVPPDPDDRKVAQEMAVSYAAYSLLLHRFKDSPGVAISRAACHALMDSMELDTAFISKDYASGDARALGNYIAQSYIEFGLQDGSHEADSYAPLGFNYSPVNPALDPMLPGSQGLTDFNRWQPLSFSAGTETPFLGPHWGNVLPFALTDNDLTIYSRDGSDYLVYHDPGVPAYINESTATGIDDNYKWAFSVVAAWSAHLDPDEQTMIDISPASLGNITDLPETYEEMRAFYNLLEGGVADNGYDVNPATGEPYPEQFIPRGDFGRVIAEFWADGPASETPPGHWFTLLNSVSDHPECEKRFHGEGEILDDLEWDVKCYFTLGGTMHDVAIAVWGIKSWYDYIRPISAIRGMAELGQSSDTSTMSYNPSGIPLIPGHIELVLPGDPLAGTGDEHVGKIKLYAWRGPDWIVDPETDYAGVDWILAEDWWPYQRPSFVTPPFAGYVSGHSTFSRAAAEILTLLTGDEYFPGGYGEYYAPGNSYLVFEEGPSVDVRLQWAKYRDASDQASLSRIWGGIHPPVDDVPGRRIGAAIGPEVFAFAKTYFDGKPASVSDADAFAEVSLSVSPNPVSNRTVVTFTLDMTSHVDMAIFNLHGQKVEQLADRDFVSGEHGIVWNADQSNLPDGMYICRMISSEMSGVVNASVMKISSR